MEGLVGLLERTASLMPQFQSLVVAICYVIGLICAVNSLRGFAAVGDRSQASTGWSQAGWHGPAFLLIIAISFVSLSSVISAFLMSFFGMDQTYAASEVFAYAPELLQPVNNEMGMRVVIAVVRIFQFVGLIAFARGIYVANMSAIYPYRGMVAKGLTHMIGGVLLMNLPAVLQKLQEHLLGN